MNTKKGGVAFFDSGIGGLTVMAECRKVLPNTTFYYYGDNDRAPYGNLPPELIKKYVFEAFESFQRLNVCAVVVACNTATAVCVEELRRKYSFPIVGIEPAVSLVGRQGGKILIICTRATMNSERFKILLKNCKNLYPRSVFQAVACDRLAGEIETHLGEGDYDYTPFLPPIKSDFVVLGCTHYSFIKKQIEEFYGCKCVDGNAGIATRLRGVIVGQGRVEYENEMGKELDWDWQPRKGIFNPKMGKMTTNGHLIQKGAKKAIKTNKSSCLNYEKLKKPLLKKVKGVTLFVGENKGKNEFLYKQMFV